VLAAGCERRSGNQDTQFWAIAIKLALPPGIAGDDRAADQARAAQEAAQHDRYGLP